MRGHREIQNATGSRDDRIKFFERRHGPRGSRARMNHMRKLSSRKIKVAHITVQQSYAGVGGKMRCLALKRGSVSREADHLRAKPELIIGERKRLQKPAAEESGAPGNEDPAAAQFFPQPARVFENVLQILAVDGHAHHGAPTLDSGMKAIIPAAPA